MTGQTAQHTPRSLKEAWAKMTEGKGFMPMRNGAAALGVPEAVLQDAVRGPNTTRLKPEFIDLLKAARDFGKLLTLVRNDSFVAMPVGEFAELSFEGPRGRGRGGPVDVRFDTSQWGSAFASIDSSKGATRRNIHFFDRCGTAALKIVLWSKDGDSAFDAAVKDYADPSPQPVSPDSDSGPGWQSAADFAKAEDVSAELGERVPAFLQAIIDNEITVDWRIPARASEERYVGPLRNLRARDDMEGWYDVGFPHFTTHVGISDIVRCARTKQTDAESPLIGMMDAQDRLICRIAIASDPPPAAKDAWARACDTLMSA